MKNRANLVRVFPDFPYIYTLRLRLRTYVWRHSSCQIRSSRRGYIITYVGHIRHLWTRHVCRRIIYCLKPCNNSLLKNYSGSWGPITEREASVNLCAFFPLIFRIYAPRENDVDAVFRKSSLILSLFFLRVNIWTVNAVNYLIMSDK